MANEVFFPPITTILQLENLPEELSFVQNGLNSLLQNLYYRDLQFSKSPRGDAAFYSLKVVSFQKIGIDIPGTGMAIVLNPGHTPPSSEFPITVSYEWGILGYLRGFSLSNFSFKGSDFYDLGLKILGVSEEQMVNRVLAVFINAPIPINQFVDDVNYYFQNINVINGYITLQHPTTGNPVQEVVNAIKTHPQISITGQNVSLIIFGFYIIDSISEDNTKEKVNSFFTGFFGPSIEDYIKKLVTPKINASLELSIGLEFPRTILVPLTAIGGQPIADPNEKSTLLFNGATFSFSTETGIGFESDIVGNLTHPSRIGNTGFEIDLQGAKLDISRKTNIPEATADGRPDDFVGVYIQDATIRLPAFFNHDPNASTALIKGRNLLIGTGGLSGTIGLEAFNPTDPNPSLVECNFGGGFGASLDGLDLTFHQNAIVESNIHGTLKIPGFKDAQGNPAEINIDIHIESDGDFSVTASEDQGFPSMEIPNILRLTIDTVAAGRESGRFFVAVAGLLDFIVQVPGLSADSMPKGLDIKKIIIWDDGQVEIEGGTLILPDAVKLKIPPVELSITAIGAGSHEQMHLGILRKYKFFEFSGGVGIHPGGVDVRGEGVRLYFTHDSVVGQDDFFVRIQGIGIDLIIPGSATKETATLIVSGFLSMKNPQDPPPPGGSNSDEEYAGGITFSLPQAKIAGSAAMKFIPKKPAFIIDLGVELSTPIPLGTTGLGIYGFRGLVGQRYVVSKTQAGLQEEDEWWRYYKAKVGPDYKEGIQISKFAQKSGFSVGAGVSLATTTDTGKSFSSKLFLLLSLPEVFLLQGQGAILKERVGLDSTTDPPFFALIAITSHSVEAAFGVDYKTPEESGKIATVAGIIEMGFFFGNSSAWYINVGKDLPVERRIQARIATLFNAYAYLMLSSSGLRTGAGASWEFKKGFGPVGVELGAYIDVAGRINFFNEPSGARHVQLGGSIQMGGYARIKVFKFKFGFTIAASLAAEAPKQFIVTGTLTIAIDLPKPLKDIDVDIEFTWTFDTTPQLAESTLMDTAQLALKQPARAINVLTKETFAVKYQSTALTPADGLALLNPSPADIGKYTIPLDSRIEIEFFKGMLPDISTGNPNAANIKKYGGLTISSPSYVELIPSQQGKSVQVKHIYRISNIEIKSFDTSNNTWVNYDIFSAITPLQLAPFVNQAVLSTLKWGFWQLDSPDKYTKLSVLAQDPLTFLNSGTGGLSPEEFGVGGEDIFCPPDPIEETCVDFVQSGFTIIPTDTLELLKDKLVFQIVGENGEIISVPNPYNFAEVLQLNAGSSFEMYFTEQMATVEIKLVTKADSVTISYYRRKMIVDVNGQPILNASQLQTFEYELIVADTILQQDLVSPVIYNDIDNPVDKVVVHAGICDHPGSVVCDIEITPVGTYLRDFLNLLAQNHDLINANLFLGSNPQYQNAYCNTPLNACGGGGAAGCSTFYSATISTTVLNATFNDFKNCLCHLSLELLTPSSIFSFGNIVGFTNLRHDPTHVVAGPHYDFLITANVQVGTGIVPFDLKGTSDCWIITNCFVKDFLLEEGGGFLKQEDDGKIIIDDDISAPCSTLIYEICWLSFINQFANNNAPTLTDVQQDNQAMLSGINDSLHPVWRPETIFAIQISTEDKILGYSAGPYTNQHTFTFRTEGTIGHFHRVRPEFKALEDIDKADQYKLSTLKYYIDYSKSYPNADSDLLNAKPLFYKNPRLLLFYIKDYVYSMLNDWGAYNGNPSVAIKFEAVIKDPIEPPANTSTAFAASFEENDAPIIPENITILNNMLQNMMDNGGPCTSVTGSFAPIGVNTVIHIPDFFLKPLKLYTALFNVTMPSELDPYKNIEVHRYNFQTSRYASFKEQVDSYILSSDIINPRSAVFTVEQAIDANDITKAQQIVNNTLPQDDELIATYAETFDRIVDGALKMGSLDAAVTNEFNIIKNTITNSIIGILIRNPEPFNDPKIPIGVLNQSLDVAIGSLSQDAGLNLIFSKDRSKIFITNPAMNLSPDNYFFTFRYFEFSGTAYNAVDTQIVQITIS